jgi:hypothetical protein
MTPYDGTETPRQDAGRADSGSSVPPHLYEIEELRQELSRIRSELAALTTAGPAGSRGGSRPRVRRSWVAFPLLGAAVLALSAQAASPDLEKRISALEQMVRRTGGSGTQVSAPFDVVGPGGQVIMRVSNGRSAAPVSIWRENGRPGGNVTVHSPGGVPLAAIGTSQGGDGVVYAADGRGHPRAQLNGGGGVIVWNESQEQVAAMVGTEARGRVVLWSGGKRMAAIEVEDGGSSAAVRVMSPSGRVVAGMLGREDVGTVAVADASGRTVAEMTGSGRGAFQIFNGGPPLAVLTLGDNGGGLLQVRNSAGVGVGSLTAGGGGAGYMQLLSSSGNPTVEAGTLPSGRGTVRAGPIYKCSPVQAATPVMSIGFLDCIVGGIE